jgi:probable phosphomutase (TIGR03848 family)
MSVIILVRHAHSAANDLGLLTGRLPGVSLSKKGFLQAEALVERIGRNTVEKLHISPVQRCQLTIDPWLRSRYSSSLQSFEINESVTEIDFGDWSGRKLSSLRRDPLWKVVQNRPSQMTFPEGESFRAAQRRAFTGIEKIAAQRGAKVHLVLSHSDTIKLVLAKYLDMKLDSFQKLQVDPASFSILSIAKGHVSVETINNMGNLKDLL